MPKCSACQKELTSDALFCPNCGNRLQPNVCACGAMLREGAQFCTQCGKPTAGAAGCSQAQQPAAAAPAATTPQQTAPGMMPPPPPPDAGFASASAANLPPPAPPWEWQAKLKPTADSLVQSLQGIFPANTPAGRIAERMARGALADPQVYRQAAEDETQTQEAMIAIAVAVIASAALPSLLLSGFSLFRMLSLTIGHVGAFAVSIAVIHLCSQPIFGFQLTFHQTVRALAYALAPLMFSFVPLAGQLLGLWSIVTSIAALRAATGCDTVKAAIALILGGMGGAIGYSIAFGFASVIF